MPGRPRKAKKGVLLRNPPTGFPLFFDKRKPRVITADPWAFLSYLAVTGLPAEQEGEAQAFIEQAFDFYEAAQNPQLGSKPLLYYYSFMNLAKAAILIRQISLPPAAKHGIGDPRANNRTRLRFEGQRISMPARAHDHSEIFPEFLQILGADTSRSRTIRVVDLLQLLPSIHRTYVSVTKSAPIFLPVSRFELRHFRRQVWARLVLDRHDKEVITVLSPLRQSRGFGSLLEQVESENDEELWFETDSVTGHRRGLDRGIIELANRLRRLNMACILTANGYRFYLANVGRAQYLPCLAASYAVIFYLGSITRYKPHYFDKIVGGKFKWVIEELLATEPVQFLYKLASILAGVDVVRPYAAMK